MKKKKNNNPTLQGYEQQSQAKEIWRRLCKNKSAMLGLVIMLIIIFFAITADIFFDSNLITLQNAKIRCQAPSAEHLFGTDCYGRDILTRTVYGARVSLTIGFLGAFISLIIGATFGSISAYYGGRVDNFIMRLMDMLMAIPTTLMALCLVAALGRSTYNLLLAIALANMPSFTRLVRSSILTVVDSEYVEAAKACGMKDGAIIFKEILPNAIGPIIVQTTQSIAGMILEASAMSFIGMGVQLPTPEWGAMISEAREYLRLYPYMMVFPGLSILLTSLSFNLLGDGLRDAFDPRLKD